MWAKCDYYKPLILSNYLKNTIFGGFRCIYFNLLILVVNHMSWKFHDMNINPMTKCAYTFSKARITLSLTEISLSGLNYNQFSKIALVWVLVYTDRQEPVCQPLAYILLWPLKSVTIRCELLMSPVFLHPNLSPHFPICSIIAI